MDARIYQSYFFETSENFWKIYRKARTGFRQSKILRSDSYENQAKNQHTPGWANIHTSVEGIGLKTSENLYRTFGEEEKAALELELLTLHAPMFLEKVWTF